MFLGPRKKKKTLVKRRGQSDVAEDGDAFGFGAFL